MKKINNLSSIFTPHKEEGMTEDERKAVWSIISTRTFNKTVSEKTLGVSPIKKPIRSHFYREGLLSIFNQQSGSFLKKKYTLGIVASILIASGSISAFAQGSLPGDLLYPIKTKVNENLRVAIAITPEAKATIEATLATKRLEEAEKLALEGKLNPSLEQQTGNSFSDHVSKFNNQLVELENRSEFDTIAKVGIFFQTRIAVHAAILSDMKVNDKILSSTEKETTRDVNPNVVSTNLKHKVLSATIPIIIVTKKALAKIPVTLQKKADNYVDDNQLNTTLNINLEEAREYLVKLHQEIGTPSPIMEIPHSLIIPTFVQQIL